MMKHIVAALTVFALSAADARSEIVVNETAQVDPTYLGTPTRGLLPDDESTTGYTFRCGGTYGSAFQLHGVGGYRMIVGFRDNIDPTTANQRLSAVGANQHPGGYCIANIDVLQKAKIAPGSYALIRKISE